MQRRRGGRRMAKWLIGSVCACLYCALRRVASLASVSDAADSDCSCPSLLLGHNRVRYSFLPAFSLSLSPATTCMLSARLSSSRVHLAHARLSRYLNILLSAGLIYPFRCVPHLAHISLISTSPSSQTEDLESVLRCDHRTSYPSFFRPTSQPTSSPRFAALRDRLLPRS